MKFVRSSSLSSLEEGDALSKSPTGSSTESLGASESVAPSSSEEETSLEDPSVAPGEAFPPVEPTEAGSSHPVPGGSSSEELAEVSRRDSSRRPENEPEGEVPTHSENESPSVPLDSDIPRGIAEVVHPSGIRVFYQAAPKRLYKVNGKESPSVTEVLKIISNFGTAAWWGMKVGVEGLMTLLRNTDIDVQDGIVLSSHVGIPLSVEDTVELLTKHKLTVNHVRDSAGARGQSVHDALEVWAEKGIPPQPSVYAPEERGYVSALCDFLIDSGVEPVASEVMVGSAKHKYAGRFDLRGLIPNGADVVVKTYPKRKPVRTKLEGGDYLLDAKTSKGTYKSHALQLAAYEAASVEDGYEPTLAQGVIHLTGDGRYELVRSHATLADFKTVLAAYKTMQKELLG